MKYRSILFFMIDVISPIEFYYICMKFGFYIFIVGLKPSTIKCIIPKASVVEQLNKFCLDVTYCGNAI